MGLAEQLISFSEELRGEGVAVGTSELLDAFQALDTVAWTDADDFREALAATIAKSPEDRHIFDQVFDRFFFRAAEQSALEEGIEELGDAAAQQKIKALLEAESLADGEGLGGAGEAELSALREAIRRAIADRDSAAMRDLARLAIAGFGQAGESSGVVGVDVQRIRRALGLSTSQTRPSATPGLEPESRPEAAEISRAQLSVFERILRRELERRLIEHSGKLPPARPLNELNRALPTNPTQDLAAIHRAVAQMKRRRATLGTEQRGRRGNQVVDIRRTMRASLETGGVPLRLSYRPKRPRRPEIYVLCDVSTSVTSASVFFLSVLHALHDSFRKLRSFVFIERISEVTEVFEQERDFKAAAERVSREGGVADVSGYTDYGRVWLEFLAEIAADLGPSSTVIVLGDARTNGREPHADVFARVS